MNKIFKIILKFLYSIKLKLTKTYELERAFKDIHIPYPKFLYKADKCYVKNGDYDVLVNLFYPDNDSDKLMIFFHGGGWVSGSIDSHRNFCIRLAKKTKHVVASVEYRLAPEFPFPIGLNDCYSVTKAFFLDNILDVKKEFITLIGDSAGGNLVAAISLMARDKKEFMPEKQILIYPLTYNDYSDNSPYNSIRENATDYGLTTDKISQYINLYVTKKDINNPYFAPLLSKSFDNQPQTLIITAQYDPLRDEGEDYGQKLKEAGNKVKIIRKKKAIHGFITFPQIFNVVDDSIKAINKFLNGVDNDETK